MRRLLRTLVIAGSEQSMEEMLCDLELEMYALQATRVSDLHGLRAVLAKQGWDLILAADDDPNRSATDTRTLVERLASETPLIFILAERPNGAGNRDSEIGDTPWILRDRQEQLAAVIAEVVRSSTDDSSSDRLESGTGELASMELDLSDVVEWVRFQGFKSVEALRTFFASYPEEQSEPQLFAHVSTASSAAAKLFGVNVPAELIGTVADKWPAVLAPAWDAILEGIVDGKAGVQLECSLDATGATERTCVVRGRLGGDSADMTRVVITFEVLEGGKLSARRDPNLNTLCLDEQETEAVKVLTPVDHPSPRPHASAGTILLVDDQDAVRSVTKTILSRNGFRVLEASSGEAALELSRNHVEPIDVLLTDISMPGMSGDELANQIRSDRPRMKVVFMSGFPDQGSGHDTFVQKPFLQTALVQTLRDVLDVTEGA